MKRVYLSLIAVVALGAAFAMMPSVPTSAAPKPTPTPTPVALQYDELVRMIMPPATPPPPGVFQDDYKVAMNAGGGSGAGAQATPAPRHHGFGQMLGSVLSGNIPGADSGAMGDAMNRMHQLQSGRVTRLTYYYSKGWVREDDPLAQTATISKCNEHQFITLDLAHKTYRIANTAPKNCNTPMMPMGPGRTTTVNEAPGTVDMTMKTTSTNLGPKTLEGIATTGHDNTFEMSMTNATGSCRNGDMQMLSTVYVSGIRKPRAFCPISARPVPQSPNDVIVRGGCKPRMHTQGAGGMSYNSEFLEMYIKMSMGGGGGENADQPRAGGFSSVTERGNVAWLYRPQADPLFEVPPGFTEQK